MNFYLRHLVNFAHIVETGTMTAAANRLDCSVSAMSESVKILESYFKEPLLERRKNGVTLTSKGMSVYQHCQPIVDAFEQAMKIGSDTLSGTIKISASPELFAGRFSEAIWALQEQTPDISLVLAAEDEVSDHTKFARDLYCRVGKAMTYTDLTTLHRLPEKTILVGARILVGNSDINDPLAIAKLPFLASLESKGKISLALSNPNQRIVFPDSIRIGSADVRLALARKGIGITSCLESSVKTDIEQGRFVRVLPERLGVDLSIVIGSPHQRPSTIVQHVADVFAQSQ